MFILDFTDAFWQIPLASEERKHFIGFDGDKLWMFRRSAQGSRNGPLAWAGPSSLLLRCTQSVFSGVSRQPDKPEARSQLYVDDPAITVRDESIATAVLVWQLHGFKLAFKQSAAWHRHRTDWRPTENFEDRAVVSIPQTKLQEFLGIIDELLMTNVVAIRKVRTLAGKASHFASGRQLRIKQIRPALLWFKAFLQGKTGALQITYLVSAFKKSGRKLRIVGDARVYGMGAYLMDGSQIVSWYAIALTKVDDQLLGIRVGDETFQQVAESLNLLVALRVWKHHWQSESGWKFAQTMLQHDIWFSVSKVRAPASTRWRVHSRWIWAIPLSGPTS